MTVAIVLRLVHVLAAVLGTGTVAAVVWAARAAEESDTPLASSTFVALTKLAGAGLGLVLVTGIGIDLAARGIHHDGGWFRLSGALVVAAGILLARARSVARGVAEGRRERASLRTATLLSSVACAIVAVVVVLMELRPWS